MDIGSSATTELLAQLTRAAWQARDGRVNKDKPKEELARGQVVAILAELQRRCETSPECNTDSIEEVIWEAKCCAGLVTPRDNEVREQLKAHRSFLEEVGIKYLGAKVGQDRRERQTRCYSCHTPLNGSNCIICERCNWIVCPCGACFCRSIARREGDEK